MSIEGELWEASEYKSYGYGARQAHPSVEWVACPVCGAAPGRLCFNERGPILDRHYKRCDAFRALRAEWRDAGLED